MLKNVFSDEVARELGYQKQYPEWWVIPVFIIGGLVIIGVCLVILYLIINV